MEESPHGITRANIILKNKIEASIYSNQHYSLAD